MDRADRIEQALNEFQSLSPPVPLEAFCARHPGLMPELAERIRLLGEPRTVAVDPAVTERGECLTAEELDEYRNASLSTRQGIRLAGHVAACSTCHQALIRARQGGTRHDTKQPPAPAVPGHTVEGWVGGGGFGDVYRGRHDRMWQERAFKVLRTRHLAPQQREREMREARLMASLPAHANRVQVHDLVECDGDVVVIMDYISGGPLSRRAPMAWEPALRYLIGAAEGLAELHEKGIVHRDIKPSNLLWDVARDNAVVADYGLAAFVVENAALSGTSGYLAPELIDTPASAKSDVFALGCTLYALLVGVPPFSAADPYTGLLEAHRGLPADALAGYPAGVRNVLRRSLDPDPARRPDLAGFLALLRLAHVGELAESLRRRVQGVPGKANLSVTVSVARDAGSPYVEQLALNRERPSGRLEVAAGQIIEFVASADRAGHLTMLNFDTAGTLDVLVPGPVSETTRIEPGRDHRIAVQLTPSPAGDRAVVIWTPSPLPDSPEAWRQRLSGAGGATRGMKVVGHWIDEAEWATVLVDVVQPGATETIARSDG